jgi:1-deoxy-D-xylulose-5-phosphate reductoisomerase
MKKKIALLGATGSIGRSTLDILRNGKDDFETVLLTSHTDKEGLLSLSREFPGALLALSGAEPAGSRNGGPVAYYGREGLLQAIADVGADMVVNGISGAAGLEPSLAILEARADLVLANKETMVMAAPLVLETAASRKARIIPVDSEHAAINNLLEGHGWENLEEILLTASGGPFRTMSLEEMAFVSPKKALAHPVWNMGPKISVDSATMANKGLEVIEAVGFFGIPAEEVSVVVHPQGIVHSMVRLKDGAIYAQLSMPDMRLPIHQALYRDCVPCPFGRLDFKILTLEFEAPDLRRFPMLSLAYQAAKQGGFYPVAYNGANETAVAAFLEGKIGFLDISRVVENVLDKDLPKTEYSLEAVLEADKNSRRLAESCIIDIGSNSKCLF